MQCSSQFNFATNVHYMPSCNNLADGPSRVCPDLNCTLPKKGWDLVERSFGPHTLNLMKLDSNCERDHSGQLLPHYSPWPTPASHSPSQWDITFTFIHFVFSQATLEVFFGSEFLWGSLHCKPWTCAQGGLSFNLSQSISFFGKKGDRTVLLFPPPSVHNLTTHNFQVFPFF